MKCRYSLRSLTTVPLLIGLSWMWVTWPDRTFSSFADAVEANQFERANAMVDCFGCSLDFQPGSFHVKDAAGRLRAGINPTFVRDLPRNERTFIDVLASRRVYRFYSIGGFRIEFVVERGSVQLWLLPNQAVKPLIVNGTHLTHS